MRPFAHHQRAEIDPRTPHEFARHDDRALGALSSSGRGGPGGLGFTSAYLRGEDGRCAVPGCGRQRDDDVHAATEAGASPTS
jgi:hypothetical protein